jgi:hypothetical protein
VAFGYKTGKRAAYSSGGLCFAIFLYMACNAVEIEFRFMTGFHAYEYVIAIACTLLVMEGCRVSAE